MNFLLCFCLFITFVFVFNFFRFWFFLMKKVREIFSKYGNIEDARKNGYDLEYSKIGNIIKVMTFSFISSLLFWILYISMI